MSRPNRGTSITVRAILVTCLVAAVSVAITTVVALPIVLRIANDDARAVLAQKAGISAFAIGGRGSAITTQQEAQRASRIAGALRDQGVETVLIRDGQASPPGLPDKIVRQVASGTSVSDRAIFRGRLMLVEGRSSGAGDGIVLLQPTVTIGTNVVLGRVWRALAAGLLAGVIAGWLLARRLGRPLRGLAVVARRLSSGDRAARAPVVPPTEIADVSIALNDLATALATSEGRQREFLTSISHELRTPLTTIKGYAEALADGVIGADRAAQVGQTMLAESEHLDRLVDDLLALARLQADDFQLEFMPVDLIDLVRAAERGWGGRCAAVAVGLLLELPRTGLVSGGAAPGGTAPGGAAPGGAAPGGAAPGGAAPGGTAPGGVAPGPSLLVQTDARRMRQVIDGLLENALRLTPPGQSIVLAARVEAAPGGSGAGPKTWAVLEVRDGGPGLTEDDLRVAFQQGALYERYKGIRTVGSGLGLALASRLVARLGGSIEAGHAPEGGARFTVRLPC